MKHSLICLFAILLIACNEPAKTPAQAEKKTADDTPAYIPGIRDTVNPKPVASYSIPVDDPAYHFKFAVNVYETSLTFQYIVKLEFKAINERDTLRIPNFGILPEVQIKQGEDKETCIIGFLDKEKTFKEYKMVSVKGGTLKVKVLNRYSAVSVRRLPDESR